MPSRYQWPASRVDRSLMKRLAEVRESTQPRVPITELIRRALIEVYEVPSVIEFPVRRSEDRGQAA